MKKFDRLPPEKRKEEIKNAAAVLFSEKGFAATTMENIIDRVSLSKGGVYRIYSSTVSILSDLMLDGMHLRNAFYAQKASEAVQQGIKPDLHMLIEMICDSLLIYPEISCVYVEFLWEKRRNPQLEQLYQKICAETVKETAELMHRFGADELFTARGVSLALLEEIMNAAVLSIQVLDLREPFRRNKEIIVRTISSILEEKTC